jgi:NitT/TauT family transport system substrate-binding protein
MVAAMAQGRIDGFSSSPPESNVAAHDYGAVVAFNYAAGMVPDLVGYPHIAAMAPGSWLKSHKDEAEKFTRAIKMSLDAIADPARTNAVRDTVRNTYYPHVDSALFSEVWTDVVKGVAKSVKMDDKMFLQSIALEKVTTPDFDEGLIQGSYTNEFTDKVMEN